MPDHLGDDMRKVKNEPEPEEKEIKGKLSIIYINCSFMYFRF